MASGVRVKDIDKGFKIFMRRLNSIGTHGVKVGIQGPKGRQRRGGINMVKLGEVHEYGTTINHPGGTPYMVSWQSAGRGGGMIGGMITFLPKGDPRAEGVTGPHKIVIPERSFLRSTYDKKKKFYNDRMKKSGKAILLGTKTDQAIAFRVGEEFREDVLRTIDGGVRPPLKPETIKRKRGETTPLVKTGVLRASITSKVFKKKK